MEESGIRVSRIAGNVVELEVPEIEVKHYPVYRLDGESDGELFQRAVEFGDELIRRHDKGEIYCVGYRFCQDGKVHLVLRKTTNEGLTQRILGVDDDFKAIERS